MTTQDNLFNQSAQETPAQGDAPNQPNTPSDPNASLLGMITNPDGTQKYADVPTALQALQHSQTHIKDLTQDTKAKEQEMEQLKAEVARLREATKSIDEITANKQAQQETQVTPQNSGTVDIDAVVSQKIEQMKQADAQTANINLVDSTLREMYGDKAGEVLKAKAAEIGMSVQQLGQLAAQSPKAALAYFPSGSGAPAAPSTSSVNIPMGAPNKEPQKLQPPEHSLLRGATAKDQTEWFKKSKALTNARLGVQE